jgi:hypothetical protein
MMEQKEAKRSKLPKTEIVCKFFLDAIKNKVYGWKWNCPNGDECHYKHCLPKDYIIKTLQGKIQEDMTFDEFMDLEENIDMERERVAVNGTKVNEKTFREWCEKRAQNKILNPNAKKAELLKKLKTGRELFDANKELIQDDDNADDEVYQNEGNQLEEETKNIQEFLWNNKIEEEEKEEEGGEDKEEVKVDEELFNNEGDLDNVDLEDD